MPSFLEVLPIVNVNILMVSSTRKVGVTRVLGVVRDKS